MRAVITAIVVGAALCTGACGVKGPLYYPNVPRDAPWPYVKPKQPPQPGSAAPASPAPAPSAPATPAPAAPEPVAPLPAPGASPEPGP